MDKQIRNIVFGYAIEDGRIVIKETEAVVVKKIFMAYIGGKSYKKISDTLTQEKVEYIPNRFDWNKNRVKRILENPKYLGTTTLPPLISEMEFDTAQKIISSKNAGKAKPTQDIVALKGHLKCGECGKVLKKYITHKRNAWICECKVSITEKVLQLEISRLLEHIRSPETHRNHQAAEEVSTHELQFIEKTISNELKADVIDEDKIKALIFSYGVARYSNIQYQDESIENNIRDVLNKTDGTDILTLTKITKYLMIYQDSHLGAVLTTGKTI